MNKLTRLNFYFILLMPLFGIFWYLFKLNSSIIQITAIITVALSSIFLISSKISKIPYYLYLFIIYIFFTSYIDYNNAIDIYGLFNLMQIKFPFFATFLILIIIENEPVDKSFIKRSIGIIKLFLILALIVSVIQVFYPYFLVVEFRGSEDLSAYSLYKIRRWSIFGLEDYKALELTFIPISGILIDYLIKEKKQKQIVFYLVLIVTIAVLSNSRTTMFGVLIIFFFLIMSIEYKSTKRVKIFLGSLFTIFIVYLILSWIGYDLTLLFYERIDEGPLEKSPRIVSFETFFTLFPSYGLFGLGRADHPMIILALGGKSPNMHIGYFSHLLVYGIFCSILIFIFWYAILKKLYSIYKATNYFGPFLGFFVIVLYNAFFAYYSIFHAGLIISIIFSKYYQKNYINEKI